jgi:hypothetical protein
MLRIATILTAAALLTVPAYAAGKPAVHRSCGLITDSDGARIGVLVLRGRPSCTTAKRVLRAYFRSHAPCGGSACVRRHFGWTCASAVPPSCRGWRAASAGTR